MNNLLLILTPEQETLVTVPLARMMTMLMVTEQLKIVISGNLEIDSEPGVDG